MSFENMFMCCSYMIRLVFSSCQISTSKYELRSFEVQWSMSEKSHHTQKHSSFFFDDVYLMVSGLNSNHPNNSFYIDLCNTHTFIYIIYPLNQNQTIKLSNSDQFFQVHVMKHDIDPKFKCVKLKKHTLRTKTFDRDSYSGLFPQRIVWLWIPNKH